MSHEDGKYPESLERLVRRLGGTPVWFDAHRKCCGFHAQLAAEHDVLTVTGQIVDSAGRAHADLIVTPCPLCQMQLDMYEPEGRDAVQSSVEIPILHLQQLIGLALGMSKKDVGFDRHVSAQEKLRKHIRQRHTSDTYRHTQKGMPSSWGHAFLRVSV